MREVSREVSIESLGADAGRLLAGVQTDTILLTRHGKPYAVTLGTGDYDAEDWGYMTDPKFWEMIQERRQENDTVSVEDVKVSVEDVKATLLADEAAEAEALKQSDQPPTVVGE